MARILVINPNSSTQTTAAMEEGIASLRTQGGAAIECVTMAEGPPGIETQEHVESVVLPLARLIEREPAAIYVIACFSDPGIHLAREVARAPVIGIAESAFLLAMGLGQKFGIVAILERSIPRHMRYVRQLGLTGFLAGDRSINSGVAGLSGPGVIERIVEVGRRLRDEDGANVLILGCASMGRYRSAIEDQLGMPVVDPAQAAVARAQMLLGLGYARVG